MSDLFYNGNFRQNIKKIKGDLIEYARRNNITIPNDLYVVKCNPLHIHNNILIVCPPFNGKDYFKEKEDRYLEKTLDKYGIINRSITYCHLLPLERMNKNAIKSFRTWIHRITDLVCPRLIVVLGEDASLSYLNQKALLRDNHGKQIGIYNDNFGSYTEIYLTYPMEYYLQKAEFEDDDYKNHLQQHDWTIIRNRYLKLVNHRTDGE